MTVPDLRRSRRSTAEERRESVLAAAERAFAARGFHGTPTTDIAAAAGISHAYLFRLFGTKSELFAALARRCNRRVHQAFTDAAAEAKRRDEDVLAAMGRAYAGLLVDRDVLRLQLQAHAASDDERIRAEMQRGFAELVAVVQRETAAGPEAVRAFFAEGMLLNVLAAMGAADVTDEWAQLLVDSSAEAC